MTARQTWRLDTAHQTLAFACDGGQPFVIYWGAPLPVDEDLADLAAAHRQDLSGGMLDRLPALSLTPLPADAWQGAPGLMLSALDGSPLHPRFALTDAQTTPDSLAFTSTAPGLTLTHAFRALPSGLIAASTALASTRPIRLHWLSTPALPADHATQITDFAGRWNREFQPLTTPLTPGQRVREARTGRSGQEHPPFALLTTEATANTQGQAWGFSYAWSGGHRMIAEALQDGRRQIQWGAPQGAHPAPLTQAQTADLLIGHSTTGLNGLSAQYQTDTRDRLIPWPDPARPRPVHYNCWEAIYFNHTLATLADIATRAAALGAERFVLDDGWFGRRDDDTTSLGDWQVDRRKWPDGLAPLIAHVHAVGMTFGLWVEPEMVNPDSDLYRAHPDWALGPPDQTLGRHQMVLDIARAEVRDYLFEALDALLREYPIDYLKWDHNRLLPVVDTAQTHGLYTLLDRLRAAHPDTEIESCASGGGRIDAGILARTHRLWLSDCIDASERLAIQHDAALFLPAAITGSHVGAATSHTTGRSLPMSFRARVAAMRHFGFEMDPRHLTEAEAATLTKVTAWWKANRHWTMPGTIHRLDSPDPALTAEIQIAPDGHRFILFAGVPVTTAQILPRPLRLTALDPTARYRVTLLNPEDAPPQSRGPNALKSGPLTLTGAALMQHGLHLPLAWPATMWMVEGHRL
ncbi:MAG: alpha-galactosidase [Gemmobacter sp.]